MAKVKKEFAVQPNWKRIKELADSSEWSHKDIGMIIGKGHSWIGDGARKDRMSADKRDIEKLAVLFNVDSDELLIHREEPKEEKKEEPKESNPDARMMHKLLDIEAKVDNIMKLLASLSEQDRKPVEGRESIRNIARKPRNERAKMLLQEMVDEGYGKCLLTNYIKELLSINIGSSYAEQAIKDCGYKKGTTGLGNNTITWILDPHYKEQK